jgi:hypothetical protein
LIACHFSFLTVAVCVSLSPLQLTTHGSTCLQMLLIAGPRVLFFLWRYFFGVRCFVHSVSLFLDSSRLLHVCPLQLTTHGSTCSLCCGPRTSITLPLLLSVRCFVHCVSFSFLTPHGCCMCVCVSRSLSLSLSLQLHAHGSR